MEEKVYFDNGSGIKLCGMLSGSGKIAVILSHGHMSSKDSKTYVDLSNFLIERDIPVLRFDFYGHGESEGNLGDFSIKEGVQDILSAIRFLKSIGYEKFIIMGLSRGGICSLRASAKSEDVIAAALVCPGSTTEDYEEVNKIAESIKIPVLIVHGGEDYHIPAETSIKLSTILENCIYEEVEGAGHMFSDPVHHDQMIKLVSEFILEQYQKI